MFGAFDGVRNWQVNSFVTVDLVEQEVISAHEERHLRLQKGTLYGSALALLGTAAYEDLGDLYEEWTRAVDACRQVHEVYATFMSVANVHNGLDTLSGNLAYLEYWSVGEALHERVDAAGTGLQVLEYLFHQLMSARRPDSFVIGGPAHLRPALRLLAGSSPNDRLRHVLRLCESDSGFVAALIESVSLDGSVEESLDNMADVLERFGVPTLSAGEQDSLSQELTETFNAGGTSLQATMTVRSRSTTLEDQLDYIAAEQIHLHRSRLPLTVGVQSLPEGIHPLAPFARDHDEIGPHVWTVLLTSEVLHRQFDCAIEDGIHFGLLSCDRDLASGLADMPMAFFMPIPESPLAATERLARAGLRTLMMTTLSTLATVARQTPFSDSEPLFVLVDERIRPFLLGLVGGDRVLWTTVAVTGDRLLHTVVLTMGEPRPLHFIWIGTIYTLKPVLEWLRSQADTFAYVGEDYRDVSGELFALMEHLIGTFAILGSS